MKKLAAILMAASIGFWTGIIFAQARPDLAVPSVIAAFTECYDEVNKGCPMLLRYTRDLEVENAKLRRLSKNILLESDKKITEGCKCSSE
jgi:hypothetical protein